MIKLEDLGTAIAETIGEYTDSVKEKVDVATVTVSKRTEENVRDKAPVQEGAYKKSISLKIERQLLGNKKATIYVKKPHYRLTHLLENGHALVDGGRSRAFPHWAPAEKQAIQEYVNEVKDAIKKGG